MTYTTTAKISILVFCLGLFIDSVTTSVFINHPRLTELNPVMVYADSLGGLLGIIAIKLVMTGLLLFLLHLIIPEERRSTMMTYAGIVLGGVWAGAGVWNMFIYSAL